MSDPDIIAYLCPTDGQGREGAVFAISMPQNKSRFIPPRRGNVWEPYDASSRQVRELTEQPEELHVLEDNPRLAVRFSDIPKTSIGLVAGRCRDADLVLPSMKGVSWYHFALVFDHQNFLVVRDLGATVGTRVIYNDEEGERGHNIDWSAHGPGLLKGKTPIIKVVGDLQFKLVVVNHDTTSKTYLDNVARFRQGVAATENLFSDLCLRSHPQTELPTPHGARTPSSKPSSPIYWRKELGRGQFGVVTYVWDVTTREEYAVKEPLEESRTRDKVRLTIKSWRKEADIMKNISHVSTEHHNPSFTSGGTS